MGSAVSNTVEITVAPVGTTFQVQAGNSSDFTGFMDANISGPVFDIGPIGTLIPDDATVGGYQVAALVFIGNDTPFPTLGLYNAPEDLDFTLSFTDNQGHVQAFSSAVANVSISGGIFTLWNFTNQPAYVPMTDGITYTITAGGGVSSVAAPVLEGLLNQLGDQILLTWTCATAGITSFLLYKNANNSSFVLYQTLDGSVFQFLDTITDDPVDDIDSAAYYVVANKAGAVSGPSNLVDNEIGGTA